MRGAAGQRRQTHVDGLHAGGRAVPFEQEGAVSPVLCKGRPVTIARRLSDTRLLCPMVTLCGLHTHTRRLRLRSRAAASAARRVDALQGGRGGAEGLLGAARGAGTWGAVVRASDAARIPEVWAIGTWLLQARLRRLQERRGRSLLLQRPEFLPELHRQADERYFGSSCGSSSA